MDATSLDDGSEPVVHKAMVESSAKGGSDIEHGSHYSAGVQPNGVNLDKRTGPGDKRTGPGVLTRIVRRPEAGAFAGTLTVYVFFVIFAAGNGFVTTPGTATWLNQAAQLGIVAIPVGLLMIAGEFDLSVASVIGAAALTVSIAAGNYGVPLILAILLALVLAAMVGFVNGIVTVRTGVPSFIVTLATYLAVGGATLMLTAILTTTTNVQLLTSGVLRSAFAGEAGQFQVAIIWCVAVAVVATYILSRTVFGNWLLATGGNRDTAREAGVPTDRVKVVLFVTSSLGAGLLGVIQAVQYNGAQVGQGENYLFDAIAASVMGGVLLQGGYGSVLGIVFGAATYGIVSAGIYYTGWDANLAQVLIGGLVLAAVLANNIFRQLAMRG